MCGICGIVHGDETKAVNAEALARMNAALAHRGPDDSGTWISRNAGLAMRRLKVIDLEGGKQPMMNEDQSVILVFNGEIYNYRELRRELEQLGRAFRTESDTEVLLRAFEAWGIECLSRLNGMFAFAVFDTRNNAVFLARDRLGIKPLHYTIQDESLYFASELPSLIAGLPSKPPIDPAALDAYFEFLYIPAPETVYKGVSKLRPAEYLVFRNGSASVTQYWRPDYAIDDKWTLESAGARYLELLTDAVRMQRVSDVPIGAFLSGGIDSSSVAGILSFCVDTPVKTFTIGFDDRQYDELRYARLASQHFATDHVEEVLQPNVAELSESIVARLGEPFADSSALPTWLVSKIARANVTVALSGDGGDELFAGYTWTMMNHRLDAYRKLPTFARSAVGTALNIFPAVEKIKKLRRFNNDSFRMPIESFRSRLTCFTGEQRDTFLKPEVTQAARNRDIDRFARHAEECAGLRGGDRMLYLDTVQYLPDDILTKVDRMSMAHSLEVRVPILDHRIVEFAATVPFHLKLGGGVSKRLVKHALRDLLPPEFLKQRKQGFAVPIHRWFREDLRDQFEDTVLQPQARSNEFVQAGFARQLLDEHIVGGENHGHRLWALLVLEHWLRAN
jgi:asparagine synthase (glutamine-hydrolysing)